MQAEWCWCSWANTYETSACAMVCIVSLSHHTHRIYRDVQCSMVPVIHTRQTRICLVWPQRHSDAYYKKNVPFFFLCVCLLHFVRCQLCTHHTPAIQHQPHASFFIQHHKKTKRTSKTWNIKQQRLLLLRVLLLYQPEIMLNNPIHSSIWNSVSVCILYYGAICGLPAHLHNFIIHIHLCVWVWCVFGVCLVWWWWYDA